MRFDLANEFEYLKRITETPSLVWSNKEVFMEVIRSSKSQRMISKKVLRIKNWKLERNCSLSSVYIAFEWRKLLAVVHHVRHVRTNNTKIELSWNTWEKEGETSPGSHEKRNFEWEQKKGETFTHTHSWSWTLKYKTTNPRDSKLPVNRRTPFYVW